MKNKIFKKNVVEALENLSSEAYQKIAWFQNDQGLSSSYIDTLLGLFDDTALIDIMDEGEIVFSIQADKALRDLAIETSRVEALGMSDAILIDSIEMKNIRQKAAKILILINQSDGSESTIEIVE